jgi:plastocyanin domain-containing protein
MKVLLLFVLFLPMLVLADEDTDAVVITIKNHRFEPSQVNVFANKKIKLRIENKDPTPEEFESYPLGREKVVPGNGSIILYVGPLAPGKYSFFGDYNEKTAQGVLIAK